MKKVFIGKNINWKQNLPFRKAVKQRFAYLPYETFIEQLRYKCQLHGITVVTQEESYTSKASFLDNDDIPVYGETEIQSFLGVESCAVFTAHRWSADKTLTLMGHITFYEKG